MNRNTICKGIFIILILIFMQSDINTRANDPNRAQLIEQSCLSKTIFIIIENNMASDFIGEVELKLPPI